MSSGGQKRKRPVKKKNKKGKTKKMVAPLAISSAILAIPSCTSSTKMSSMSRRVVPARRVVLPQFMLIGCFLRERVILFDGVFFSNELKKIRKSLNRKRLCPR